MQYPSVDGLGLPLLPPPIVGQDLEPLQPSVPMTGLELKPAPKAIISVYKSNEFLYPKDGVCKEDNSVVSMPLSLTDDNAWMTLQQGKNQEKDGILTAIALERKPTGFFLCYSYLNKEVRIKQDSRDIWVLKTVDGARDIFTIGLSVREDGDNNGDEPMLLTYKGDNEQVYMATPLTDERIKERQYWKIVH